MCSSRVVAAAAFAVGFAYQHTLSWPNFCHEFSSLPGQCPCFPKLVWHRPGKGRGCRESCSQWHSMTETLTPAAKTRVEPQLSRNPSSNLYGKLMVTRLPQQGASAKDICLSLRCSSVATCRSAETVPAPRLGTVLGVSVSLNPSPPTLSRHRKQLPVSRAPSLQEELCLRLKAETLPPIVTLAGRGRGWCCRMWGPWSCTRGPPHPSSHVGDVPGADHSAIASWVACCMESCEQRCWRLASS